MCGFVGAVVFEDRYRLAREQLGAMTQVVRHRGPDAQGLYISHEGPVSPGRPQAAMGHCRLAIIDLDPRASQPMTDGRRWIAFNGEIYNYRELRNELSAGGVQWRTASDTEVLLAAYAAWGPACLDRLNGMYAFAVWDANDNSLFLARDRMGQKPLYVACVPRGGGSVSSLDGGELPPPAAIAFASELQALTRLPWVDRTLRPEALRAYLALAYVPAPLTIWRGVWKMPPATAMTITARGGRLAEEHFTPNPPPLELDDSDAVRRTRQAVTAAVGRQLVADVPLGCFLSGGVDSSVIAAAMKRAVPRDQPVMTFAIGFDDRRYDETWYAAEVGRHLHTEHRQFMVRPDATADLPKLAATFGEPFGDSSALPTHYLSRETRQHVKVALSGDGGDELFGGYDRYRAVRMTAPLDWIPRPMRWLVSASARLLPGVHPKGRFTRLKRLLRTLHLPAARRYESYMRLFDARAISALLLPEAQAPSLSGMLEELYAAQLAERDHVAAALAVDRVTYLPDDLLVKLDRCSMLHALEVRSPFMDHELVSLAASLSSEQLLRGGTKRMLREAFAADLPAFVFKRPKMGFAVPIGQWLRTSLRDMIHDLLNSSGSFATRHFHRSAVDRLLREHEEGVRDHSERLYSLLMLELWTKASADL